MNSKPPLNRVLRIVVFFSGVLVVLMQLAFAENSAAVLAKRGDANATAADHRAAFYSLDTETDYTNTLRDVGKIKITLDEILDARQTSRIQHGLGKLSDLEANHLKISSEKAYLNAALAITDNRARRAASNDPAGLERRASEIYQVADAPTVRSALSADFQNILFDLRAHPFPEIVSRINAAQAELAAGVNFDEVATKYSDENNAATSKGWARNINGLAVDGPLGRVIFNELKPGEYSKPTTSRVGIHIIKLHAINKPEKRPFREIKGAIMERLVAEAGKNAQRTFIESLSAEPTRFIDTEISKIHVAPDRTAQEEAKRIAAELAAKNQPNAAPAKQK